MSTRCHLAFAAALAALGLLQPQLAAQEKATAGEKRAALISELTGSASIQERASAASAAVERFAAVSEGAMLSVRRESRATIVLSNGKRFVLDAGARATVLADRLTAISGSVEELPALPVLPRLVALEASAPKALGGVRLRSTAIVGLSPSNGSALASRATLRFKPVAGAATYHVEIEDEKGRAIFGVQTTSPEVRVPPDILTAGAAYYWTVRTLDRPGAQARGSAEFATLRAEEATAREHLLRRLHAEGDVSSVALLAAIDRHLGLYQEALEGFRAALTRSPDDRALIQAVRELEAMRETGGR